MSGWESDAGMAGDYLADHPWELGETDEERFRFALAEIGSVIRNGGSVGHIAEIVADALRVEK